MLSQDDFTFGKYKGRQLKEVLLDRKYCKWIIEQDWFKVQYEYLYNRIKEYNPTEYFLVERDQEGKFEERYRYFNLVSPAEVKLEMACEDMKCYEFYYDQVRELKEKIIDREQRGEENIYDIKAPSGWLKMFEKRGGDRERFKSFLTSYELPNITTIVEDIKKEGDIEYKGSRSFLIAKERSRQQEEFWEIKLSEILKEDLGVQYKYENCFFDFICIPRNILFECKLGLKDFDSKQYRKYRETLGKYNMVYLIGRETLIDMNGGVIYTTPEKEADYTGYQCSVPKMKLISAFDSLLMEFKVVTYGDLNDKIRELITEVSF